jgi:hypothetical protein
MLLYAETYIHKSSDKCCYVMSLYMLLYAETYIHKQGLRHV